MSIEKRYDFSQNKWINAMTNKEWFIMHPNQLTTMVQADLLNKISKININIYFSLNKPVTNITNDIIENVRLRLGYAFWAIEDFTPVNFIRWALEPAYSDILMQEFPDIYKQFLNFDDLEERISEFEREWETIPKSKTPQCSKHEWVPLFNVTHLVCKHCGIDKEQA